MFFKVWDIKNKQMLCCIHKIELGFDNNKEDLTCDVSKTINSPIIHIDTRSEDYVFLGYNISKDLYDADIIQFHGSDLKATYSIDSDDIELLGTVRPFLDHAAIREAFKEKKYDIVGNYCEEEDV